MIDSLKYTLLSAFLMDILAVDVFGDTSSTYVPGAMSSSTA